MVARPLIGEAGVRRDLAHLEVLGPRATLDQWLASLQDLGRCHLADALAELEGCRGVGRPEPTLDDLKAEMVRSEALTALRAVARVLPPSPARPTGEPRPAWSLGPGEVGAAALLALRDEARALAERLRGRLEALRDAEAAADRLDALRAGVGTLERAGEGSVSGSVWRCPPGRRRRLARRLARLGQATLAGRGERGEVLLQRASAPPDAAAQQAGEAAGAQWFEFPAGWRGRRLGEVRTQADLEWLGCQRALGDAQAALRAAVAEVGPRGRLLLDSLEEAEQRRRARHLLAATPHLVAARVWVPRAHEGAVHDALAAAHGDHVVVRALAPADDAPTLRRHGAAAPLRALGGLAPARFGDASLAALLALAAPLAVGWAWADVAGGLLLLLAGALLGRREAAEAGAPRRDTALLAQLAGLAALLSGVLHGGAFGQAGQGWFGVGWGWLGGAEPGGPWAMLARLMQALAAGAGALAGYGLLIGQRRAASRALALAGLLGAAAAAPGGGPLAQAAGWVGVGAALAVLLLEGARGFAGTLLMDLVGTLRLAGVGAAALLLFDQVSVGWLAGSTLAFVLGPAVLLLAALVAVLDPAHLAMGVPYDLAFGARSPRRPFEPFARRLREAGER